MDIITKEIETKHGIIKVHGILTGQLAIKKSAMSAKRPGLISTVLSFRDKEFGAWLPVWTWVIEHPEGIFLIDTGLSTDVNERDYFKKIDFVSKYYFEKQMKFRIGKEEEISAQLEKIGLTPASISKVVITHLHIDHTGGLKYFPKTPILVGEQEWKTKDGSFPQLFPNDIGFQEMKLNESYDPFDKSHFLTAAKDLVVVATPGHTRGHVSVILKVHDDELIVFGGDVAYTQDRLINAEFSATVQSNSESIASCSKVLELSKRKKVIFLPSHDIDNGDRLMGNIPI